MTSSAALRQGSGAYGRDLAQKIGAEDAPFIVTQSLQRTAIAFTEIRVDQPTGNLTDPLPIEDAHMMCLLLRELPDNHYWEVGRHLSDGAGGGHHDP
jgi:AraC family transcriptional regulator